MTQNSSRSRLLRAAKRLFARQGYEQTATSAIAREAGTSESQLMRYFGGKVGLLEALFNEAWGELNEKIKKARTGADTNRDAIVAVLRTVAAGLARDRDLATLFLFEGRRLRGEHPRVLLSKGSLAFGELARALVRQSQATREIDQSLDAAAVTSALLGACEGMIRDRVLARANRSRAFAEREILKTLEAMLSGFSSKPARGLRTARAARTRAAR